MVPAPLIGRFMESVARGLTQEAAGLPGLGVHLQHLQSPSARRKLRMGPKHTGVMITHVDCTGSSYGVLKENDVILEARSQTAKSVHPPKPSRLREPCCLPVAACSSCCCCLGGERATRESCLCLRLCAAGGRGARCQ